MGLFDNIILPEDLDLPKFNENPRYDKDGNYRLWQTKDLTRGQDRYRLRKLGEKGKGSHQLERRVPPVQKMTKEGNKILDEDNFLWWNIVRPTKIVNISLFIHNRIYEYNLEFKNGTLRNIEFVDIIVI